eukprot:7497-Heterococcus_DN1.PRE.1
MASTSRLEQELRRIQIKQQQSKYCTTRLRGSYLKIAIYTLRSILYTLTLRRLNSSTLSSTVNNVPELVCDLKPGQRSNARARRYMYSPQGKKRRGLLVKQRPVAKQRAGKFKSSLHEPAQRLVSCATVTSRRPIRFTCVSEGFWALTHSLAPFQTMSATMVETKQVKSTLREEHLYRRSLTLNPVTLVKDTAEAIAYHWKNKSINWPMGVYITLVHVAAVIGLMNYVVPATPSSLANAPPILCFACIHSGLGITGGVHRLWAHRSYDAHWTVRVFLMLINSMANQGSIYHWARDHRVHHKHSETDADPHNAQRGFFFAHMGWLYVKKHPEVIAAGRTLDFSDLERDPVVMFQDRADPWFALFMCFMFPGLIAKYGWGENFWVGFWVAGALRYCFVLHCTWLVNSAAHMFGDHPYDNSWPAENPMVSILSVGEGWHNWHHKYPFDYAASEFGVAAQYNPTKLFIDSCAKVGLVSRRKRALGAWEKLKERRDGAEEETKECVFVPDKKAD